MALPTRPGRLPALDLLRGLALVAMALYHFSWDLRFFGFVDWDLQGGTGWRISRYLIAGSFLALVGVGLVLWDGQGRDWRRWAVRLGKVVLAAAAVTAVTRVAIPGEYIFFGILHSIAAASVLGLLFLRLPVLLNLVLGVAVIVLPALWRSHVFDAPWLLWLGLGTVTPISNDYEPLFPWFGPVLLGMAAVRLWLRLDTPGGAWGGGAVARPLRWAGRHSLAFYLLHQPVLIGLLLLVGIALGRNPQEMLSPPPDTGPMMVDCQIQCENRSGGPEQCYAYCSCMIDGVTAQGLWPALEPDATRDQQRRLETLIDACSR